MCVQTRAPDRALLDDVVELGARSVIVQRSAPSAPASLRPVVHSLRRGPAVAVRAQAGITRRSLVPSDEEVEHLLVARAQLEGARARHKILHGDEHVRRERERSGLNLLSELRGGGGLL
jgi:hypothetical protein